MKFCVERYELLQIYKWNLGKCKNYPEAVTEKERERQLGIPDNAIAERSDFFKRNREGAFMG